MISVQRVPVLRICHAFHTVPNISLLVVCKMLPIEFALKLELAKFELFVRRKSIPLGITTFFPEGLDYPVNIWSLHASKHVSVLF